MKHSIYWFHVLATFIFIFDCVAHMHIIYVHLGNAIPTYAYVALEQARLFNENATICLITNQKALNTSTYNFNAYNFVTVACETLKESCWHTKFKKNTRLNAHERDGFWRKATERFFYLHEYMATYGIKDAVHLEYDNMLYANVMDMYDVFSQYKGIGAVFDCDSRCIPSFMYIAHAQAIEHLVQFISERVPAHFNDMQSIASYRNTFSTEYIDNLPLIMPEYLIDHTFINQKGNKTTRPSAYYNKCDLFNSIFDGAALGQYLGGIDPRNGPSKPGFINETCLFNPAHLNIEWRVDSKGRKVPFALCKNKAYRINNLHIHSKKLEQFRS